MPQDLQIHQKRSIDKSKLKSFRREWLPALVLSFGILFLWQLVTSEGGIPHYILPQPTSVAKEIGIRASSLLNHLYWTMVEAVGGFVMGSFMAFLTAVTFVHVRIVRQSMYPWAVVLQTVPIVAIAPLLTIWMGFGLAPKATVSAIICFFPMLVNSIRGLRSISVQAMELMNILSASKMDILFRLRLPSSLPYVFNGLKVTSTLAVVGAIVGEFTGADNGIGKIILIAGERGDTRLLFAGIFYSSLAAILLFAAISLLERLVMRWPGARQQK